MSEIMVVYWSGTGNTEAMAGFVGQGIKEGGKEAKVVSVSDVTPDDLKDCQVFALGCPSMGAEQLEEGEMEPFVEAVKGFASGKTIGLFGSYGWGDGEWMRNWEADCAAAGISLACDSVICQEAPDDEALSALEALGKTLAA